MMTRSGVPGFRLAELGCGRLRIVGVATLPW